MAINFSISVLRLKSQIKRYRKFVVRFISVIFLLWYVNCLPEKLFDDSTSTVLLDRNGNLLAAHISEDEQWRFEECDSVPYKFKTCIIQFEDRNFYYHIGFSVKGISRALIQNVKSGRRVSGGSTLTMQLVRLMQKNPPRTYTGKIKEIIMATRVELRFSKEEILRLYASHAPFGNNVVGLDAASWRFFGRPAHQLSWAESATLAVLPNAPGLIYPGKNHDRLLAKRNRLLKHLFDQHYIDEMTYNMSLNEPLPDKPLPLKNLAPHLLNQCSKKGMKGLTIESTIDLKTQQNVNQLLENHMQLLRENKIHNGAVLVASVKTGEIIAYAGNAIESGAQHSNQVDCIIAPRSSGSILKPLLYGKSLEAGIITPEALLPDIPSKFGSFSPKNFSGEFDGLIPANQSLSRSLNIPFVHLLNRYGAAKFHSDLNDMGLTTINRSPKHYGLSLILGGAEVKLFDLANVYSQLASSLANDTILPLHFIPEQKSKTKLEFMMDKGCIYSTFDAMVEVNRPDEENNWQYFVSSRKIAWKTGTSFGFRDAWAIGVTPDYVVAVWVGNADGEGRPGLTGVRAAAPLLFSVFKKLPAKNNWFKKPLKQFKTVEICSESGLPSTRYCTNKIWKSIPASSLNVNGCSYHQRVHLNKEGTFRVDADCYASYDIKHESRLIIPSSFVSYYKKQHPEYKTIPPMAPECQSKAKDKGVYIIYPKNGQRIYQPVDFNEQQRKIVFEAIHIQSSMLLYWHLDENFYGQTSDIHQLEFNLTPGKHTLTVIDENGAESRVTFSILGKRKSS